MRVQTERTVNIGKVYYSADRKRRALCRFKNATAKSPTLSIEIPEEVVEGQRVVVRGMGRAFDFVRVVR